MKKFILMLFAVMCFTFTVDAQTLWYKTTGFKSCNVYNGRYQWPSQWEKSNMNISIDFDNDLITIYSPRTQYYYVYGTYTNGQSYRDNGGGATTKFYAIDQDGDKCEIRLRIESNGNSQIYVDFSNCAWVYNVRKQ